MSNEDCKITPKKFFKSIAKYKISGQLIFFVL